MSENKQLPHDRVLDYFYKICSIPHVSKNEKSISEWVVSELKKFGGDIKVDEFHQIYASFPASKGYEHLPIICLQAHLDMVGNKKNNSNHDFNKDPINVYEEGGFLKAKDTTLGADNGIGVATILAIISDNSIKHGPLECMFTAQEEIGGVAMKDYLKFKYVLNLDNESYGNIDIGGAGLVTLKSTMDIKRSDRHPNSVYLNIEVHNFLSGHSGNRISEKRANAIKQIFY
jgi:dipeptidase D